MEVPLLRLRLPVVLATRHRLASGSGPAEAAHQAEITKGIGVYEQPISRKNRGCIVFLLDRSDSMKQTWGASQQTLAEGAASAVNDILFELCLRSQVEPGKARYYFDVGIFGYGIKPGSQEEGVAPAFDGVLAGKMLVPLPDLRSNPIAFREVPSEDLGGPPSKLPIWVRPMHGRQTPMCQAIAVAGAHVYDWAAVNPNSFPPIVINITDGMVTDNPYQGANLDQWGERLTSIATNDGNTLLFNIFISPATGAAGLLFPASSSGLPFPGPELFKISSPLPERMVTSARSHSVPAQPGARGFGFNANSQMLVKFLEVGTRLDLARD